MMRARGCRGWWLAAWVVVVLTGLSYAAHAAGTRAESAAEEGCQDFDLDRAGLAYLTASAFAGGEQEVPTGPASPSFSDVLTDYWAYRYIEYCRAQGIAQGYENGTYQPEAVGTRAQMAVLISRALAGGDATVPTGPAAATFEDVPADYWAYRHVEYLNQHVADAAINVSPLLFGPDLRMSAFTAVSWLRQVTGVTVDACPIPLLSRERTERVSRKLGGGEPNGDSGTASVSAEGRYVAFASVATDLVPDDENGRKDVFVYDRETRETTLVSVSSGGVQGDQDSDQPSLSADGRYVAFASLGTNLVPDDTNFSTEQGDAGPVSFGWDIFVHDRVTGVTERVSLKSDGTEGTHCNSYWPSLSADGRYVAFEATDFMPGAPDARTEIYVHDRETRETRLVSVATDGTQANGRSVAPSMSANGRVVAFWSEASNLVPDDTNAFGDIFVRDLPAGATERVSVGGDGAQANAASEIVHGTVLSADGRCVAFASTATNLGPALTLSGPNIYLRDRTAHVTELIEENMPGVPGSLGAPGISISGDGRFVAFFSRWHDFPVVDVADDFGWVYLRDRVQGTTTLASMGDSDIGLSRGPALSANGRAVAFESLGRLSGDVWDVFVRVPGLVGYGAISGTITDAVSQAPVPGAAVWVDGALWADGSTGVYTFPSVLVGDAHTLTVSAPGYLPVSIAGVPVAERETTTRNIQLTTGVSPPVADFAATPLEGTIPLTVTFTDASTGGPTGWAWDFGDGGTSSEQNPIHTYRRAGHYTVALTALTAGGSDTKVKERYLLVRFTDVPEGFWAEAAILACVDAGIVTGYPNGAYVPAEPVTREQMAVYVARGLAGGDARVPSGPAEPHFPDVPTNSWAYKYVEYARARNIAEGFPDGTYGPTLQVDRAEMAVYMARAAASPVGEGGLNGYTPPTTPSFPDVGAAFWAYKYVEYVKAQRLVSGYPDGLYHPEIVVTRDQMAVYVARVFKLR